MFIFGNLGYVIKEDFQKYHDRYIDEINLKLNKNDIEI
jgi:hypothetical protein